VAQWTEELTSAVVEHGADGFIYRTTIYRTTDDTPPPVAVTRFAQEVVPAVREAVSKE
jgi:hypothetical protein